jgi:hypothetical protein
MKHLPLLIALAAPAALTAMPAHAQDIEDLDSDGGGKKGKKGNADSLIATDEIVREIERGWFLRANAGTAIYLLRYGTVPGGGALLRPGTLVGLTVGQDFVDEPGRSMAWEVQFSQGVHNGMPYQQQVDPDLGVPPSDLIQGDTRTYSLTAAYEFSGYPTRRLGIGFRVGGGIMFAPLVMNEQAYREDVVSEWGGAQPTVHNTPHFPVFAGPTLEYYTKLSHFSIGIDADIAYVIGFDLGINATGFMKYTF